MLASGVLALLWVTPIGAEHRGVRPKRQRQHDGENSCPKHDTLGRMEGKRRASLVESTDAYSLGVPAARRRNECSAAEFRRRAPKIPHRTPGHRSCRVLVARVLIVHSERHACSDRHVVECDLIPIRRNRLERNPVLSPPGARTYTPESITPRNPAAFPSTATNSTC